MPQSVDHASSYNLRNSHNLRPIATRTNLYYNSFLPSVIRDWNKLSVVVRQLDSVCSFKKTTSTEILLQHVYEQTVAHYLMICSLKTYLNLHYAVVVPLKTLNISSLDALDTLNTEHCSLTRSPSTSQFLSICYYMEVVYYHMKPMLSSFKWYISTYQTLSVLLNIHLNCS